MVQWNSRFVLCGLVACIVGVNILSGCHTSTQQQPDLDDGAVVEQSISQPIRSEQEDWQKLELNLSLDKNVYRFNEPIQATVSLKYFGEWFMLTNVALRRGFELKLPFFDPQGDEVKDKETEYIHREVFPQPFNRLFVAMYPNSAFSATLNLQEIFEIVKPGEYTIRAVYTNVFDPEDGASAWKGILESNIVHFTIEP